MKKIGLALSGGGFRATLYHLGLIRFLRDAGILQQVTHITSVSGGSIMAAHLALNWDQYTGTPEEFDQAASQLIAFTHRDVRNRILRRFPLGFFLRWPRRLLGLSNRQWTRTGLLESQYEKHLYGDKSLFELPERPHLHILTTNLSEGCLCSFNRDGIWKMQQKAGRSEIERIRVGLATIAMAVTASSAFPGFFPPLELTGRVVGARGGEFGRQAYTDGGVFDNLGVRMFRWLTPLLTDDKALDGVLVSDVGKRIVTLAAQRGGMIRAAMRSSDILMDRVWQLESENFLDTFGYVFARVTDVVSPHEDSTALHPEVQRQVAAIRTDLDLFSPLETSCLIRHGYCMGRKACRSREDLFGSEFPTNPPWDPVLPASINLDTPSDSQRDEVSHEATRTTIQARELQASASRRIWSTMVNLRDWTSYVYLLIIPLFLLLTFSLFDYYQRSHRVSRFIESISQDSRDFKVVSQLIGGPIKPFDGVAAEEVGQLDPPEYKSFNVIEDSSIVDLRPWNPTPDGKNDVGSLVYETRRLKVQKAENKGNEVFRVIALASHADSQFRFPPQHFQPRLRRMTLENVSSQEKTIQFEISVDLSNVPAGQIVDLAYEQYSPGVFLRSDEVSTTIAFRSEFDAPEVTRWVLMPRGREYRSFKIYRSQTGKPGTSEVENGFTEYLADNSSILAYKMAFVKVGYTFEVTWFYK